MERVLVLAISLKEEKPKGWVKLGTLDNSWQDLGAHFDKSLSNAIEKTGVYDLEIVNVGEFGAPSKFEINKANLVVSFEEIAGIK